MVHEREGAPAFGFTVRLFRNGCSVKRYSARVSPPPTTPPGWPDGRHQHGWQHLEIVSDDPLLDHLSPLGWEHINLTGDYIWHSPRQPKAGKLRPLRRPGIRRVIYSVSWAGPFNCPIANQIVQCTIAVQ